MTFERYTGQEKPGDRDRIRNDPPDILLTNYVMLELMLTRPGDRQTLIHMAEGLEFLVFDELHTYRGRQGADVAMLIRRVKDACAADERAVRRDLRDDVHRGHQRAAPAGPSRESRPRSSAPPVSRRERDRRDPDPRHR